MVADELLVHMSHVTVDTSVESVDTTWTRIGSVILLGTSNNHFSVLAYNVAW